ncbi:MAG: hypothetical protein JNK15_22710 [Planctomycetes bacterium]|nr:hypothetical protein [Planctomycetota bacterium]
MSARFELVLDGRGKFHFQLCSKDDDVLLRGVSCARREQVELDVNTARRAMQDVQRLTPFLSYDGGCFLALKGDDDRVIARTSRVATKEELAVIARRIRAVPEDAPLIDATDKALHAKH